jgi:serine/threonine-protein kinase HipA
LIRLPQEDMCQALNVPPSLKYENRGGPGITSVMALLLGSGDAVGDRYLFFKTQILFWLLAAIDGHAKNFSIFLLPGGNYRLTPMYDVLSAHHLVENRQIMPQKLKMAMAIKGREKHYTWERMLPRHWFSTAHGCRFPADQVETILDELLGNIDAVIAQVGAQLPATFPARVAEPVFNGMLAARELFVTNRQTMD